MRQIQTQNELVYMLWNEEFIIFEPTTHNSFSRFISGEGPDDIEAIWINENLIELLEIWSSKGAIFKERSRNSLSYEYSAWCEWSNGEQSPEGRVIAFEVGIDRVYMGDIH